MTAPVKTTLVDGARLEARIFGAPRGSDLRNPFDICPILLEADEADWSEEREILESIGFDKDRRSW